MAKNVVLLTLAKLRLNNRANRFSEQNNSSARGSLLREGDKWARTRSHSSASTYPLLGNWATWIE